MVANGSKATTPLIPGTGQLRQLLNHVEYHPEGRETVVLLHDMFQNGASQWETVRPFLPTEFRTLVVDWPGHGGSVAPENWYNDAPRQLAVLLSQWLTYTVRSACHIVAAGLGAYAAIHLALSYPLRVKTLTLTGFLHHADSSVREHWMGQRSTWNITIERDARSMSELSSRYKHDGWQKMNLEILNDLITYPPHTLPDDFERLDCPLLIVAGDAIEVERKQALQIRDWAPQGHLAVIPDAGHNAMLDAPGVFGVTVSRFLRTPV